MKKKLLLALLFKGFISFGQFSTLWPLSTTNNTVQSGYIGIGTKPTSTSTSLPNFNLQLHGTTDYLICTDCLAGLVQNNGSTFIQNSMEKATYLNYGKTTRLGLTNTTTGLLETDGTVIRQSSNDFYLTNQETSGNLNISAYGIGMTFSGLTRRIWVGGTTSSTTAFAKFNIESDENGFYLNSISTLGGKFGFKVKMANSSNDGIQIFDFNNVKNFSVTGGGVVYARRYNTTLSNIPDYVFESNYNLLTFEQLRSFVTIEKHLPNIPSAKEFEQNGVDLGELNRLLLEKTEELTLYILQLEARIKALENK